MGHSRQEVGTHDVPEPESFDEKEVYAFFGLASYLGQVLERGAVHLAVGLKLSGHAGITSQVVNTLFYQLEARTFGQIIGSMKHMLSDEMEAMLMDSVRLRNWLVHRFFFEHSANFMTEQGRAKMIVELRSAIVQLREADRMLDRICEAVLAHYGVTADVVQRYVENLREQSRRENNDVPNP